MHHAFDRICIDRPGKFFLVSLVALYDRHGKIILAEVSIYIKLLQCLFSRFFLSRVKCVTFLPEELAASQKRACSLLPTENRAPLVVEHREITPGVEHMAPVITEKCLGGRPHAEPLGEFLISAVCDPGALGGKALNMIFFFLEKAFGNEYRHGNILVPAFFEFFV